LFSITGFTTNSYLLLTYLLASIPLPVNNFVRFTSISFFYVFDFTGLGLGLVGFGLGLTLPGLSFDLGLTVLWYR